MNDMKRILKSESIVKEAEEKWKKYVPKIIAQAKLEKGVHVEKKLKEIGLDDQDGKYICTLQRRDLTQCYITDNNPVIAAVLLPYLLPDSRSKPDGDKIIQLSYVRVFS